MKFSTEVESPKRKRKNDVVRGLKSHYPSPNFAPVFHPRDAFSMRRFKHRCNEARGPIVAVKSSNDVPRERLYA